VPSPRAFPRSARKRFAIYPSPPQALREDGGAMPTGCRSDGTVRAFALAMKFEKIMCPIDFSDDSREALSLAAGLARESSATLVVVYGWEMTTWAVSELTQAPAALQELIDQTETELARWKRDAKSLGAGEVQTRSETGAAWDRIVAIADADPAIGLIVMGTHGRTGVPRALLGSVAEKVVRHAPCSVLVARER
jgi:universal stress protein A